MRAGGPAVKMRLEWKPQDVWIGVFWRRRRMTSIDSGFRDCFIVTDVWICLLPMLPLHLRFGAEFD